MAYSGFDIYHATTAKKDPSYTTTGCIGLGDKAGDGTVGTTSYNGTTGILTISQRGGYSEGTSTMTIRGPGTLYTTHLDLYTRSARADDDHVSIENYQGSDKDWTDVKLTGNYSACIRMSDLEKIYMDKNLAPGTDNVPNDGYHTSNHNTEETQNNQAPQGGTNPNNQLCHDVLTGKVLNPAPIVIPTGSVDVKFVAKAGESGSSYSTSNFADGFTLQYVYDDWYYTDITTEDSSYTFGECDAVELTECGAGDGTGSGTNSASQGAVSSSTSGIDLSGTGSGSLNCGSGTGTPPGSTPTDAWFVDADLRPRNIEGLMHVTGDGPQYKVYLEKVQQPGTWGFLLDDNAILFGPKDTWGHKGSRLPYYASGGSTMTDAPSNLIDQGEIDSLNGGLPDPTPNNLNGVGGSFDTTDSGEPAGTNDMPSSGNDANMDHQGTGGLINTAGGGPVGSRAFNKHGDVIPGSARGMHPDYWDERVVIVDSWGPSATPVTVTHVPLQRTQGSPPSPMYRFQIVTCDATDNCDRISRNGYELRTVDIGMYEPKATFYGDLDPKTRVLQGEITVVAPAHAMGLQGFRLYPTNDGETNLELRWSDNTDDSEDTVSNPTFNAQFIEELAKSCPPDSRNEDWGDGTRFAADTKGQWFALAKEECGNDNPYSPKCRGKSCTHINILPGSQGEFYISRYDNYGNAENPHGSSVDDGVNSAGTGDKTSNLSQEYTSNTGQRNYGDNEWAQIYLPRDGWLTPILMDVNDDGDTLVLKKVAGTAADCTDANQEGAGNLPDECVNIKTLVLSDYHDIAQSESMIEWKTDGHGTKHGWTLIFQPDYPEVEIPMGTPMAQGASGYRVVNVYGSKDAKAFTVLNEDSLTEDNYNTEYRNGGTETVRGNDRDHDAYVETYDWLVPNVTCTPTTMHCPLPSTWAHINYTTPSLYPEPAEGSCLQQKNWHQLLRRMQRQNESAQTLVFREFPYYNGAGTISTKPRRRRQRPSCRSGHLQSKVRQLGRQLW
jgi:hypothetical protein